MSFITNARDAIKDLAISDIVRERLSIAIDRLAEAESKIEVLQTEKGGIAAALERERLDHQKTRDEYQRLKDEHSEEIFIHKATEFRRGKSTGGKWVPFCPKCKMPATAYQPEEMLRCSAKDAGENIRHWYSEIRSRDLASEILRLPK